jgi:hypothetical protein
MIKPLNLTRRKVLHRYHNAESLEALGRSAEAEGFFAKASELGYKE